MTDAVTVSVTRLPSAHGIERLMAGPKSRFGAEPQQQHQWSEVEIIADVRQSVQADRVRVVHDFIFLSSP